MSEIKSITSALCACETPDWQSAAFHLAGPGAGECRKCARFVRNAAATTYVPKGGVHGNGYWREPATARAAV